MLPSLVMLLVPLFGLLLGLPSPGASGELTGSDIPMAPALSGSSTNQPIAHERNGDAPTVAPTRCFDFNKSGVVDVADIQQVADLWHQPALLPYDCDGDGITTVLVILCVSVQFGQTCYRPYGLNFSPYISSQLHCRAR